MAINLLAIISIVFVIFAGAIVALFVLHFKHKKSTLPGQVATNAEDVSNLQTNLASLKSTVTDLQAGKGFGWGPWTINNFKGTPGKSRDEFQICHNGKVQFSLEKNLPLTGPTAEKVASTLYVQTFAAGTVDANNIKSPNPVDVNKSYAILIDTPSGVTKPSENKWNYASCGSPF